MFFLLLLSALGSVLSQCAGGLNPIRLSLEATGQQPQCTGAKAGNGMIAVDTVACTECEVSGGNTLVLPKAGACKLQSGGSVVGTTIQPGTVMLNRQGAWESFLGWLPGGEDTNVGDWCDGKEPPCPLQAGTQWQASVVVDGFNFDQGSGNYNTLTWYTRGAETLACFRVAIKLV